MAAAGRAPWWTWAWPALAWVVLVLTAVLGAGGTVLPALAGAALIATVFAAV